MPNPRSTSTPPSDPSAWFLGPKAEHGETWRDLLADAFADYMHWRRNYFPDDPILVSRAGRRAQEPFLDEVTQRLDVLVNALKADFPFYHPRYLAHMTSGQTLPAVLGYFAAMLYNPNNVTEEAAPVTAKLEREVGGLIAEMLGYERDHTWAHITSGGTVANLEALWVARSIQFVPLALQKLCRCKVLDCDFEIGHPEGTLRNLSHEYLLHLPPADMISMPRALAAHVWQAGKVAKLAEAVEPAKAGEPQGAGGQLEAPESSEERFEQQVRAFGEDVDKREAVANVIRNLFPQLEVGGDEVAALVRELDESEGVGDDAVSRARQLIHAVELIDEYLGRSDWNPARAGYHNVASSLRCKPQPLVFASEAAHYSIRKACDVLGYGAQAVQPVPLENGFRINVTELETKINQGVDDGGYVAAVIGVVGTTETGAVDPIHELVQLRDKLWRDKGISFWIHVDAAWGGYIASLFRGHGISASGRAGKPRGRKRRRDAKKYKNAIRAWKRRRVAKKYKNAIRACEQAMLDLPGSPPQPATRSWADEKIIDAYLALGHADSITVDPHKLGYVPYPAGVIAFKSRGVTDLVAHKANYIADWGPGAHGDGAAARPPINDIGAHILEGSKPGAAAAACWLAHTTIPLDAHGHGQIICSTLLSAQRLASCLEWHNDHFSEFEEELERALKEERGGVLPKTFRRDQEKFTFEVLGPVDSNIVCYVVLPPDPRPVERINQVNRCIYARLGKPPRRPDGEATPYGHPYFLSRTVLEPPQYSACSLDPLLGKLGVATGDYERHGLFVLRSTVMNPHYAPAACEPEPKDYLCDFVRHLHRVARKCINT
jgi:glutamate/tyrosine decarboxylase-like PLP-dependent enzyme